jgi:hypothetical protein
MSEAAAVISTLPPKAAKMAAVEVLLADPESLQDDVLACSYPAGAVAGGVSGQPSLGASVRPRTQVSCQDVLAVIASAMAPSRDKPWSLLVMSAAAFPVPTAPTMTHW